MRNIANNILYSGYIFDKDENLKKFRFSLLNSILIISTFFTLFNYFSGKHHFILLSSYYLNGLLGYALVNILTLFLLRQNKYYYTLAGYTTTFCAVLLFYFALFETPNNELRIIWFYVVTFVAFILFGKRFGFYYMLTIMISIFFISQEYDLGFSNIALFTFFNSFFIFSTISFFFLKKIEQDEKEFLMLNKQLQKKVSKEVRQREMQEQMLLSQCRLASMGEMINAIAHQWRQPLMGLNAILLNMDRGIDLGIENKQIDVKLQSFLEVKMDDLTKLTEHMSRTIEVFRNLSSQDKEKELIDISLTLEYILDLFRASLQNIDIEVNIISNVKIYGYNNELIQAIIIVLTNAIEIFDKLKIKKRYLKIDIEEIPDFIILSIEDNAGGIKKENMEKIFDPYFTTKKSSGGSGIGLYIAKMIIEENMKGKLFVENSVNGAKFTILLRREPYHVKNT